MFCTDWNFEELRHSLLRVVGSVDCETDSVSVR